ncbi:MAG TPA: tRNA pseudouridine(38-40) synthase TruA [Chitinophagaceae bacterium]|nr:tRNA pseudouridine(38-40) synthase TruA [Chitinophagaceae bacterium]HRF27808.1 tRNA pseudouridine(38-40) synthase TruA [Ferruginibacter sp.]
MARYFLSVAYQGSAYAGFQVQQNAVTIQSELERAMAVYFREPVGLTGSSRTDKGVHAVENYFHFDFAYYDPSAWQHHIYHINAILPPDIVVLAVRLVRDGAHCRFDALSREYEYRIYQHKNPFLDQRAYFFPFKLDLDAMRSAAAMLMEYDDFSSFSKRNTQVKTFICNIMVSEWICKDDCLIFHVQADRFLRGMVRGLTGTMLRVGTGKVSVPNFAAIIDSKDCTQADFSVPAHGLYLMKVAYPDDIFIG